MMRKIYCHGTLGERFQPFFEYDCETPAEGLKALCLMVPGFERAIRAGEWNVTRLRPKRSLSQELDYEMMHMRMGDGDFHIIPIIQGEGGKSGLGKILAGALLIAVAFAVPAALGLAGGMSASLFSAGGFSLTYGQIAGIGFALVLSGVAQMMAPHNNDDQHSPSFVFSGQVNVTSQGGTVPIGFGRFLCGTVVISAGVNTEKVAMDYGDDDNDVLVDIN